MSKEDSRFELLLKNEKLRQYDRMAIFFIFLNLVYFVYASQNFPGSFYRVTAMSAAAALLILVVVYFSRAGKKSGPAILLTSGADICISWLLLGE